MLKSQNVRSDTDIGMEERRRWCNGKLKDCLILDRLVVHYGQEGNYLCCLFRLVRNSVVAYKFRGFDLFCFEDPINGF